MMTRTLSFLFLLVFSLWSCQSDEEASPLDSAIIHGLDVANCGCCGNWLIQFDGTPFSHHSQFTELPPDSDIDLENATFPLAVKVDWEVDSSSFCNFILIKEIELE